MTLEISPELEELLIREAERRGTTAGDLALNSLRAQLTTSSKAAEIASEPLNLVEFLGDFVGRLDSGTAVPGGARLSEDTGRGLTAILLGKQRQP